VLDRPAGELAALVRSGEVSSRELVEASLERIGELNGELNAFIHVDAEGALATADAVSAGDERPFAGVPIAIKDTAAVEGLPFSLGSELFGDFVPAHDAFVVRVGARIAHVRVKRHMVSVAEPLTCHGRPNQLVPSFELVSIE